MPKAAVNIWYILQKNVTMCYYVLYPLYSRFIGRKDKDSSNFGSVGVDKWKCEPRGDGVFGYCWEKADLYSVPTFQFKGELPCR